MQTTFLRTQKGGYIRINLYKVKIILNCDLQTTNASSDVLIS